MINLTERGEQVATWVNIEIYFISKRIIDAALTCRRIK